MKHMPPIEGVRILGFSGATLQRLITYVIQGRLKIDTELVIFYAGGNDMCRPDYLSPEQTLSLARELCDIIMVTFPKVKLIVPCELAPRYGIEWNTYNHLLCDTFYCVVKVSMYMMNRGRIRSGVLRSDGIHLAELGNRKLAASVERFMASYNA